jgi:hypothetical protein
MQMYRLGGGGGLKLGELHALGALPSRGEPRYPFDSRLAGPVMAAEGIVLGLRLCSMSFCTWCDQNHLHGVFSL